jgi:hypothetical protein
MRRWTKGVRWDDIDSVSKNNHDEISQATKKKLSNHYVPSYSQVDSRVSNETVSIIVTIANHADTKPLIKIHWELDCNKRMFRSIYAQYFERDTVQTKNDADPWEPISPESNTDNLFKILCKKRK